MASGIAKMVLFRSAPSARFGWLASRSFASSNIPPPVPTAPKDQSKRAETAGATHLDHGDLVPKKAGDGVTLMGEDQGGIDPLKMVPTGECLIYEGPERDLINFPRPTQPLYPGRTRMGFIPEEYFDFFYKKTGVTGPYVFGASFITFLLSKEFWVIEHNWPSIPVLAVIFYFAMTRLGPKLAEALDKDIDEQEKGMIEFQENAMKQVEENIKAEEQSQWMAKGQSMLFDAKRENVRMQLEAEYRNRLSQVYKEVKRRLDYQIEIQNARRRVEQRHMVSWIVNNVMKAIDERQEKQNIDQCIANLQRLSTAQSK